ncbi:MAG: ABC transporter ATP-binding protein [Syntrophales bacterium]|nr:ABC transporter ATP-binding protein [Syntrophales bacterium]MDD5232422.1 ABC transporter ATP-binding protein [Syntrophales bacterium]MDD5531954.1 ABC transporter ATP-binding protein [Syntrophales bacterium]
MLLQVKDLTHYFGGLCAVSNFNLELGSGELVGIIGPNGAGKTTIFNLITGVYRASRGSIVFEGTEITGMKPHRITGRGIARTFQNIRLFNNLTVLDNIRTAFYSEAAYGPLQALFHSGRYRADEREIARRSFDLLSIFRLSDYSGEISRNLPYGLQRRLEIARALAARPQLLLLDEPAAGMNPNEIRGLMDFIIWIKKNFSLTILLIEHQMPLVMGLCERLEVLDFGETIARGTPEEIRSNRRVLEAYLGEEQKP